MKKCLLFACLISIYSFSNGQTEKIDSLWKVYNNKAQADTNRLKAIQIIAWSYNSNNPDSAILLSEKQLELANSLENGKGKMWIAKAYNTMGVAFENKGNYPQALDYYLKALKLFEKINYKKGIGFCYNNMAALYFYQTNYAKTLEFNLKALKIKEEIGDKRGIGTCYGNIGAVYLIQKNYPKALEYYFKDLKIIEEFKDKQAIGTCYSNIGIVYKHLSDYSMALEYFSKSLQIRKEIGDKQGIGVTFNNISELFILLSDFKKGIQYCDSALRISVKIGDIDNERLIYGNLAKSYSHVGKYKDAYECEVKFKTLTDSIFNVENSKQLGDLKTNFEVRKKENELKIKAEAQAAITNEEKKRQRFITYSVGAVLILVMVFAGFMVNRFRVTDRQKKIIQLKEQETQKQNEIISHQKHIVEEKHKEITDSINYAERIQRSFIASKETLDENLKDYFVFFLPKDIVSGDFYWAGKLKDGNFALVTADSTGHGVPGAIMSLLNITSIEKAIEICTKPSEILNATRKAIIERLKKDGSTQGGRDGMDASLTVYDFKNKKLMIAAANNPVWIVRGHETIEIEPDKMPVGKHDKDSVPFTQREVDLQKGDVVYTLTDGYADQFGGLKGKKFMSKNLRELLSMNAHLPMKEQKTLLEFTFRNWIGNIEQVDDVCIIGIRL